MTVSKEQKRAILASLKWGRGSLDDPVVQDCPRFVQDCRLINPLTPVPTVKGSDERLPLFNF